MRLIHTESRDMHEFFGSKIPKQYAILSHTWEEGQEISYTQYLASTHQNLSGYAKIDRTCSIAAAQGIKWAWIDTCCIDKRSSAELSEAINSMFRWYQRATICYVYLSDLAIGADWDVALGHCRWFTRGWTLQELIAPANIVFFDQGWNTRDNGTKIGLCSQLHSITNINIGVLRRGLPLKCIPVAQKLSWAAKRCTTRIEDRAYSLLGIFDLNMPLLYGEEEKSFMRLQDEIIRSTADLSILAWSLPPTQTGWVSYLDSCGPARNPKGETNVDRGKPQLCGLLARSPADFHACGDYDRYFEGGLREFSTSNMGIKTRIRMFAIACTQNSHYLVLPLHCMSRGRPLGVRLRQVGRLRYFRQDPWTLHPYDSDDGVPCPPIERQLCIDFPTDWSWPLYGLAPVEVTMQRLRNSVLRVHFVRGGADGLSKLGLNEPWPVDRYDHESALFFVSQNAEDDYGLLDLTFTVPRTNGRNIRCMIFTLGWSKTSNSIAQYGITKYATTSDILASLKASTSDVHLTSSDLVQILSRNKVPCTQSVSYRIGETGLKAWISIETAKLRPNTVSHDSCVDLTVKATIVPSDYQAQPVPSLKWRTFRD